MDDRDPNIESEYKHVRAFIFVLTTAFLTLVAFLLFLFSLTSCATQKSKCPAYGVEIKNNKSNV